MKLKLSPELRHLIRQLKRKWLGPAVFSIFSFFVTALAFWIATSSLGRRMDINVLSIFFSTRGPIAVPREVITVSIDDKSYKTLESSTNYPLPRKFVATAFEHIADANPKLLILDLKFPAERTFDPESDARMVAAIERSPATIWSGRADGGENSDILPSDSPFRKASKMELDMLVAGTSGYRIYIGNPRKLGKQLPVTTVDHSTPDPIKAAFYERVAIAKPLVELANYSLGVPGAHELINFYGPSETIERISLVDLITPESVEDAKKKLHGKVVLVGYQSLQYGKGSLGKDEFPVPVEDNGMFGVEIHANIVGNLIEGNWLKRFSPVTEVALVCVFACIITMAAVRKPSPIVIISIVCTTLLIILASYVLFSQFNFFVSGLGTIVIMTMVTVAGSIVYFDRRIKRFEQHIKKTFNFEFEREV